MLITYFGACAPRSGVDRRLTAERCDATRRGERRVKVDVLLAILEANRIEATCDSRCVEYSIEAATF